MNTRPYIICHMTTSLDGKVTGNFLSCPECESVCEEYYRINREMKPDAFACGRVTMERSFTGGWYPDISTFADVKVKREDYIANSDAELYAVSFDRKGRLGWKTSYIVDDDPGYGNAHIIEVLCENLVVDAYLAYLQSIGISYIFGGKNELDLELVLHKLWSYFSIDKLLLEGGSELNGSFEKAGLIDELSLVQAPIIAESTDKPLFYECEVSYWKLENAEDLNGVALWLRYNKVGNYDKPKVKLSVVIDAIESLMSDEWIYYYDLKEHTTIWISDSGYADDDEERELLDEEPDRFLRLPTKYDIREYDIMENFIEELPEGKLQDSLARLIRGRGAFGRFKDGIRRAGIEQQWYDYQAAEYRRIAIRWCRDEDVQYEE